jgi:sensor domain CHASE-containing protein
MKDTTLTDALADLARRTGPGMERIVASAEATAPAQGARLAAWLERCVARETAAATEEQLAGAVRDLVTLRNGRLLFVARPVSDGGRREPILVGDLGGAVALGRAVIDLLRCVANHDRDLAIRLARETQATDARQRAQIARAIG